MWACGTRFELLVQVMWELQRVGPGPVTSVLVAPAGGEPVLWVIGRGGRRDAVLALAGPMGWRLLWRGMVLDPAEAVRRIAMAA